ncbi:hypothetical protein G7043_40285 [Lentzea sp. NEAU-D13]|uniref:HTH luxR-type domain-containing protein n=1 Tax=Lentzea alba TaxID=2714351 RepID=A0A7C9S0X8_9PSEU|nr:LuxR C-terminal-related transcriptional regulator [Lentzea alba]NGY65162.1 hypothetical protein [Lentzea alba]
MIFHVLGPLEAHSSTGAVVDLGTRKAGTVLGVLLLHPNAWVRTDEVLSATWQEQAVPAEAKANLKTYVSQLRRALPPFGDGNRIEARPGAYRLRARTARGFSARLGALALALAGADIRTMPRVPLDVLIVDRALTVLPAERGDSVAAFELACIVTTTVELFERVWRTAVPFSASVAAGEVTDRERELLTLLFAGRTDEAAAARLNLSVRTVRRTVSQLMDRLGARSRFQAGAKAAGRGWLLDHAG